MPNDLSLEILFLLFLGLFVLLGSSPVLQRLIALVGKFMRGARSSQGKGIQDEQDELNRRNWKDSPLNDHEIMVLRKIALAGGKGMSRSALVASLYFQPAVVDKILGSLSGKGLIRLLRPYLFGERFLLSPTGQEYAIEHDLVPRVSQASLRKG